MAVRHSNTTEVRPCLVSQIGSRLSVSDSFHIDFGYFASFGIRDVWKTEIRFRFGC